MYVYMYIYLIKTGRNKRGDEKRMLKDWIKQSDLNYISKNSSQIDNTHYGSLTGYSEFMCSKLDKTYFVIKMINGVILSKNKFSNKAEAKKYIINYIKNNSTF